MSCFCQNCGSSRSEHDAVCSKCGSNKKRFEITCCDSLSMHDQINGKIKSFITKKVSVIFKIGDNFFKKTKKWHVIERLIDRKNNLYKEYIKDERGNTIKDVIEPLSNHTGHGSAKKGNEHKMIYKKL
jgi:hypothetical protein